MSSSVVQQHMVIAGLAPISSMASASCPQSKPRKAAHEQAPHLGGIGVVQLSRGAGRSSRQCAIHPSQQDVATGAAYSPDRSAISDRNPLKLQIDIRACPRHTPGRSGGTAQSSARLGASKGQRQVCPRATQAMMTEGAV